MCAVVHPFLTHQLPSCPPYSLPQGLLPDTSIFLYQHCPPSGHVQTISDPERMTIPRLSNSKDMEVSSLAHLKPSGQKNIVLLVLSCWFVPSLSFPQPNSSSVLLWYFGRTMMYAGLLKAPWSWVQMLRLVSPLAFPTLHTNPDSWNRWNMNDLLVSGKVCVKMTWCKGTLTCRLSMSNCQDVSVCSKCCHLFNSWLNSAVCHQSVHLPPSVSLLPPWSLISMMALASVWLSPSLTWWTEPTSSPLDCLC